MTRIDASQLLRPGLLQGVSVVLAGVPPDGDQDESIAGAVDAACTGLGARVLELPVQADRAGGAEEPELDRAVDRLLADAGSLELLVVDGAGLFARTLSAANDDAGSGSGSEGSRAALSVCLDASWNATRAVVNRAFLPGGRGGRSCRRGAGRGRHDSVLGEVEAPDPVPVQERMVRPVVDVAPGSRATEDHSRHPSRR